jgi:hypothetical protein
MMKWQAVRNREESTERNNLAVFSISVHLKFGLIRGVAFGGRGLIRGVASLVRVI